MQRNVRFYGIPCVGKGWLELLANRMLLVLVCRDFSHSPSGKTAMNVQRINQKAATTLIWWAFLGVMFQRALNDDDWKLWTLLGMGVSYAAVDAAINLWRCLRRRRIGHERVALGLSTEN
jgi:hypothetical protein